MSSFDDLTPEDFGIEGRDSRFAPQVEDEDDLLPEEDELLDDEELE